MATSVAALISTAAATGDRIAGRAADTRRPDAEPRHRPHARLPRAGRVPRSRPGARRNPGCRLRDPRSAAAQGPVDPPALEQKIRLAAGPLKVAIERLRRRGVVRDQPAADRRHAGGFELTEEGRTTITKVYARHTEDIETVMGVLTPEERRNLSQSLKKVGLRGERCQHARSKDERGGLAPWQLRRATEDLADHPAGTAPLQDPSGPTRLSPPRLRPALAPVV